MKVIWTLEAEQDRFDVWNYIATDNPRAGVRRDEFLVMRQLDFDYIQTSVNKEKFRVPEN